MMTASAHKPKQGEARPTIAGTRQRIVDAALQVFSEHGYKGATTRAIASRAGVNEVTLFRQFGNKKALLAAVLDQYSALPALKTILGDQLTGDYRQDLIHIGVQFLSVLTLRQETLWLMLGEARRQPEIREVLAGLSRQGRQLLSAYLRQQMRRGVVRKLDDKVVAEAFVGMLLSQVLIQNMLGETTRTKASLESVVARYVDIFVHGTQIG